MKDTSTCQANHTAQTIAPETVRTEFGFARTECACERCASDCRVVPGYLVPADVERLSRHLGYRNPLSFAAAKLLASPGATVLQEGRLRQLPTLVPRRQANGACVWMTTPVAAFTPSRHMAAPSSTAIKPTRKPIP